jgi:hypothetical protein
VVRGCQPRRQYLAEKASVFLHVPDMDPPPHRTPAKLAQKYKVRQQRILAIIALKEIERKFQAEVSERCTHKPLMFEPALQLPLRTLT